MLIPSYPIEPLNRRGQYLDIDATSLNKPLVAFAMKFKICNQVISLRVLIICVEHAT